MRRRVFVTESSIRGVLSRRQRRDILSVVEPAGRSPLPTDELDRAPLNVTLPQRDAQRIPAKAEQVP